jgi:hypothetical protein
MDAKDFTDPKLIIFLLITSIGVLSYLGINMKEITVNKINSLISSPPANVVTIPSSHNNLSRPSKIEPYHHDDGILLHSGNRVHLSTREKLPPATNEMQNTFGENMGSVIGCSFTPSVSKLMEKRGTKNAIHVFPSNSFTLREPID